VNYALAVLALSAACVAWYLVQRAAARGQDADCEGCDRPGCSLRDVPHTECPEDPEPAPTRLKRRSSRKASR
jgi:hypothetical protein